jgi:hypothetical protein
VKGEAWVKESLSAKEFHSSSEIGSKEKEYQILFNNSKRRFEGVPIKYFFKF